MTRSAVDPWPCLLPLDRCSPESKKRCIYCSLMADPAYRERSRAALIETATARAHADGAATVEIRQIAAGVEATLGEGKGL